MVYVGGFDENCFYASFFVFGETLRKNYTDVYNLRRLG